MLRCTNGSTGAEGVVPARLTSSLDNSTLIAPMPLFMLSVQPMPKADLTWFYSALRNKSTWRRRFIRLPSDAPMVMHRLNRCHYFLPNLSNASQQAIGSFKFILSLDFHYALTSLRQIGLVILMMDWTWRLDDRLDIASWRWIRHVDSYPWT